MHGDCLVSSLKDSISSSGFLIIDNVNSIDDVLDITQSLGEIRTLNKKDIQIIQPSTKEKSKSKSLGAISPHLNAISGLGKSLFGAVTNNKTGNEGKFQEAQAIKEKNKVALNPVMNFNNSAPSFNKGGYFKLFKKWQ